MACSYEHTGTFNPSRSYIKVFTFHHEGRFAPYTCTQCDEAWCMRACPVDAISVDLTTGAKVISDDKCVGCKVCTIACPFGTVNYSQATGKVVKCDLSKESAIRRSNRLTMGVMNHVMDQKNPESRSL
jgi:Fe-S-cluster-containing hydrogenase component 2